MEIINRIVEQMRQNGFKDAELERALGIKSKIVYGWRNGRSKSYMDHIPRLAEIFNVTTEYLLCRTDNPAPIKEVTAALVHGDHDYSDLSSEDQAYIKGIIVGIRAKHIAK